MTNKSNKKEPFWLLLIDIIGWTILFLTIFYLVKKLVFDNVIYDRKILLAPIMMIFAFFLMTLVKYNPALASGVQTDKFGNASESDSSLVSIVMTFLKTITISIVLGILYFELNS